MTWTYSNTCLGWQDPYGGFISNQEILERPEKHPYYRPPAPRVTVGEEVLGFAFGSPEAWRQRLAGTRGHLYYAAIAAVLRARRP